MWPNRIPTIKRGARRDSPLSTHRLDLVLLAGSTAALVATILYPTLRLTYQAFFVWDNDILFDGIGAIAARNTVLISVGSVITSGIVGTFLAFLLTQASFPGRWLLSGIAYLPMALPPLVGVLSFLYIIGPDGFIPRFSRIYLGLPHVSFEGPWAILLIHTYSFYVYFYAMVSAALETMDYAPIEAARTLGSGRVRIFMTITAPLLRSALLGAALLTFLSSGASFSAPLFFGADFPVLSTQIYQERSQFRHGSEVTLTVTLAILALIAILIMRTRRISGGVSSKGARRTALRGPVRLTASLTAVLAILIAVTPHIVIVWLSLISHRDWRTEVFPTSWTFENYLSIVRSSTMLRPIINSVWMSAFAAVATLLVALPCGYLIARRRKGGYWLNLVVMIPWALPGTVVAINLLVAFSDPWIPAAAAFWMLPLGYFVRSAPLFVRMTTAAIEPFDTSLIEAGRSLGAGPRDCLVRIVLPLLAPAIIAAAAMVFCTCLGEFVASILLYLPQNMPISVKINEQWRGIGIGAAFAYSVFLMILVTATFTLSRRFASRVM